MSVKEWFVFLEYPFICYIMKELVKRDMNCNLSSIYDHLDCYLDLN